jgi:hypothetical protein
MRAMQIAAVLWRLGTNCQICEKLDKEQWQTLRAVCGLARGRGLLAVSVWLRKGKAGLDG